jgi:hypothetical protein
MPMLDAFGPALFRVIARPASERRAVDEPMLFESAGRVMRLDARRGTPVQAGSAPRPTQLPRPPFEPGDRKPGRRKRNANWRYPIIYTGA